MKKLRKIAVATGVAATNLYWLAGVALADKNEVNIIPEGRFANVANIRPGNLVSSAITMLFIVAFVVALIFLVIGGIKWIISGGDKAQTQAAQQTVTYAVLGLIVVILSYAVLRFIEIMFGINFITNFQLPNFYGG